MSEHDDELASAYLDDAATPEERARVEADPTILERVKTLRRVRDVVASAPVPAPVAEVRDAAIRAAVREPNVVDLRAARARRRLRTASIAAAIVLVVGIAGLFARSLSTSGSTKSAAARSSSASSTAGGPSAERNAAGAAAAVPYAANAQSAALGSFTDRPSLAAAAKAALSTTLSTSAGADRAGTGAAAAPSGCAPPAPDHSVTRAFAGTAVLDGEPVQVDVFTLDDGSQQLVVTDVGSCTTVFTQGL